MSISCCDSSNMGADYDENEENYNTHVIQNGFAIYTKHIEQIPRIVIYGYISVCLL